MAEHLWFTTAHLTILQSKSHSADGISLIEHHMARDFAVPLHVHRDEEESFYMLEGRLRLRTGDEVRELDAGEAACIAAGVPHSLRVVSPEARFLTVTTGRFEDLVRNMSRPAALPGLPPQDAPTPQQIEALVEACRRHGIEFVGPPVD
jgi:quercetin dioxygenase-like cupin family protein